MIEQDNKLQELMYAVKVDTCYWPSYIVEKGHLFYKERLVILKTSSIIYHLLKYGHESHLGGYGDPLKTCKKDFR